MKKMDLYKNVSDRMFQTMKPLNRERTDSLFGIDWNHLELTEVYLSPIGTDIECNISMRMIEKIKRHLIEKVKKNTLRYGIQFAVFAVCLEIFEHTLLPAIMIYIGRPELSWIGATPLDEFVIYPIAIWILRRR